MAVARKITRGLSKIEVGVLAGDGGPGTSLNTLGFTDRDSAVTLIEEDPTIDRLYSHEEDDPLDTEITAGAKTLLFTLVDPDPDALASVFGGSATGSGTGATYDFPDTKEILIRTVKITPRKGMIITIPRGALYGKINADFARSGKFAVDIVVEVTKPTKAGVAPMIFGPDVGHVPE